MDMNLSKLWETVEDRGAGVLQSIWSQRVGHDLATERQQQTISATETQYKCNFWGGKGKKI